MNFEESAFYVPPVSSLSSFPPSCSPLLLNCFNMKKFTLFMLGTVIVPYFIYHVVSESCNWQRKRKKSISKHYETIVGAFSAMSILWFLGNYEQTYSWTTFTCSIIGILSFGYIAEKFVKTHKHTLATMHKWNCDMKFVVNVSLLVISIFTVHHVHIASSFGSSFKERYIGASFVPILLAFFAYRVAKWESNGVGQNGNQLLFHLHHVHLFYALAFFTRFPEFWSRVAAGLCLGASMHGAAAYGFDGSFEEKK